LPDREEYCVTYRFLLIIFIFSLLSSAACAGISVSPLELIIAMDDQFIVGNTGKTITVFNTDNQEFNVTWYIENPTPASYLRANKTFMPNLSWVDVEPQWIVLPPNGKGTFTLFSTIPDRTELYDQHWEVWVTFKSGQQGMFAFEHAVRVYIDTPSSATDGALAGATDAIIVPLALIALIAGVLITITFFSTRRHHTRQNHTTEKTYQERLGNQSAVETHVDEALSLFERQKK